MGQSTDPFEYGNNCALCFPAGKTPKYLIASFTGIQQGPAWPPDPYYNPNGIFRLTQITPCGWLWGADLMQVAYSTDVDGSELYCVWGFLISAFDGKDDASCIWSFENEIAGPDGAIVYYGGRGQVGFLEPGSSPSLADVAELLNIERGDDTKADFIPVDDDHWMVKFANVPQDINILIKHDFT